MMKKKKSASVFARGGWKMLICAVLFIAVVLSGFLAGGLGRRARIDLTKEGLFTLSDTTLELLSGLEETISIYSVYGEETDSRLTELLACYAEASDNVQAQLIRPEQTQYFTAKELTSNSLIVTNGRYADALEYEQLYTMEYETEEYYQTLTNYSLVAEDRINKAIANVTADLPLAYLLAGHGEAALEPGLADALLQAGCHTGQLYLAEIDEIPQDCAMIICSVPQTDITEKEADMLIGHIDRGGSFFLITDAQFGMGEQLGRVTEHVGLRYAQGIVMEGDMQYMFGADYPYYLLPEYNAESALAPVETESDMQERMLIGLAHAIEIIPAQGYDPHSVLDTSETSYRKPNAYLDGVIERTEGDPAGPFSVAASSEGAQGGKVFWLAGSQCMEDMIDQMVLGSNYACAARAFGWMHENTLQYGVEDVAPRSVLTPAVKLSQPALFIGVCAAVPVALFVLGVILCVKRHNRAVHIAGE